MENETSGVLQDFRHGSAESFEAAFETLFHQHQRAVYGWILRITRNPAAAEELTVESFWRIHQARSRFDPAQGFEGWARRIATRAALDWLRSAKREATIPLELCTEPTASATGDPAINAEIRRKTALAFETLPPKLRIAATLAVIEELPHKEVAEALGISVAAVKVRIFRALRLLRKELERQGIRP
jgi:RNA polymerase sigma-70 factor (ECF subfamily)